MGSHQSKHSLQALCSEVHRQRLGSCRKSNLQPSMLFCLVFLYISQHTNMHDKSLVTNLKPFFLPRRCSRKSHCKDFREHLTHLVPCAALRHFIFTFRHCKQARGLTNGQSYQTIDHSRCLLTSPLMVLNQQAHRAPFSFSLSKSLKVAESNTA